jgi:preprotein translocase subunit SecG
MAFFIGLLTFAMVVDCLILVLLVLMQLPKKDAGAGVAFGGAATDALFGAGSGNFLTKATKYAATTFFVLALILSILQSSFAHRSGSKFEQLIQQQQTQPSTAPATAAPAPMAPAAPGTNMSLPPPVESRSAPAVAPTNPAASPPK